MSSEIDEFLIQEDTNEFDSSSESDINSEQCGTIYDFQSSNDDDEDSLPIIVAPKRKKPRLIDTDTDTSSSPTTSMTREDSGDDVGNDDDEDNDISDNVQGNNRSEEDTGDGFDFNDDNDHDSDDNDNGSEINTRNNHDDTVIEHVENSNVQPQESVDSDSDSEEISLDIKTISRMFRKTTKKYGISQRKVAKDILHCTQSTVSELFAKAERVSDAKVLTRRGKELYIKMQEWLRSPDAQKETKRTLGQEKAYGARTDRKKPRAVKSGVKFTAVQMAVLVKLYQKDTKPSVKKLQLIAETLSLEIKQIRTWFNNQRARNFPAGKEFSAAGIPEEFNCFVNDF